MNPRRFVSFLGKRSSFDEEAVAETLGIDAVTAARILQVDPSSPNLSTTTAARARQRAVRLKRILGMLESLYGDLDYAVSWLKTPSVLWSEEGDLSAIDLMAEEEWGMELVCQTVDNLYRGEPDT